MTLLTSAFAQGTHAARPAATASNKGFYYFETDTQTLFQSTGTAWIQLAPAVGVSTGTRTLDVVIDGGGSVISTGIAGDVFLDFACTISKVTLLADRSGSIVVDIWKSAYASFPPTVANTITASDLPTLSSQQKNQDSTLTGWTTSISAGDVLRFNVNSASTITRLVLALTLS